MEQIRRCQACKRFLNVDAFYQSYGKTGAYPKCRSCCRQANQIQYLRRRAKISGRYVAKDEVEPSLLWECNRVAVSALFENFLCGQASEIAATTHYVSAPVPVRNGLLIKSEQSGVWAVIETETARLRLNMAYNSPDDLARTLTRECLRVVFPIDFEIKSDSLSKG